MGVAGTAAALTGAVPRAGDRLSSPLHGLGRGGASAHTEQVWTECGGEHVVQQAGVLGRVGVGWARRLAAAGGRRGARGVAWELGLSQQPPLVPSKQLAFSTGNLLASSWCEGEGDLEGGSGGAVEHSG